MQLRPSLPSGNIKCTPASPANTCEFHHKFLYAPVPAIVRLIGAGLKIEELVEAVVIRFRSRPEREKLWCSRLVCNEGAVQIEATLDSFRKHGEIFDSFRPE